MWELDHKEDWTAKICCFWTVVLEKTLESFLTARSNQSTLKKIKPEYSLEYISVLYRAHLCMKCSLVISNFLEEIASLCHSVVFLYFFALITEEGFLISPCYSSELCIKMGISFLFSFAFCFSSFHSYLQASPDSHFAVLHFFPMGVVLIPVSYTMSQTSVNSSSGTLSIRSRPLNLFLTSTV